MVEVGVTPKGRHKPIECYVCGSTFTPSHGNQKTCCGENARKRFHEKQNRAECPQCGQLMGSGSAYPSHTPELCRDCIYDNRYSRTVQCIALRAEGFLNYEIDEELGFAFNTAAQLLSGADEFGLEVPPAPYYAPGEWEKAA
jgi:rubredoxin